MAGKQKATKETARDAVLRIIQEASGSMPVAEVKAALVGQGVLHGRHAVANAGHKLKDAERAGLLKRDKGVARLTASGKKAVASSGAEES